MRNGRFLRAKKPNWFCLLLLLAFSAFLLPGCGGGGSSDDYDEPAKADNPATGESETNVLLEPATLKSWIDQGLVAGEGTFDQRAVIIDYGPYDLPVGDDETPRIEGACKVAKEALVTTRFEGVADATPLVATGDMMDAVIQEFGIDEDTTIIFTTSSRPFYATRAYWTFRYWGFPKERLKLLNGGNDAFAQAYPDLMTLEGTDPERTDYSVADLDGLNNELRASIGELINIFDGLPQDDSNLVLDARGSAYYNGTKSTSGLMEGDVVVVDGHPEGGEYLLRTELLNDDGSFKSASEIRSIFEAKGWTPDKKVTVYCTSAYSATPLFFALDAILDAPVQLHDGSWSQTGKYSDYALAGGEIPAGNNWAIDGYLDPATTLYNFTELDPLTIETLKLNPAEEQDAPFTGNDPTSDSDVNPAANDVETQDMADVGNTPTVTISEPSATSTLKNLIEPSTLQSWMDSGLVNAPLGQERVVILDASPGYSAGHIPGAQAWSISEHVQERLEGPAPAVNMAVNATRMNQLVQGHSIDENTTIVLTTGAHPIFAHRPYFLFRYYGWPKSRLKVLNGHNGAWPDNDMTTAEPSVPDSSLTVQAIGNLQPDLRLALPEFMDALRDNRGRVVDVRGDSSAAGTTSGVFDNGGDYVVFEGTPKNGTFFTWTDFMIDRANGNERFKSPDAIRSALNAKGINPSSDGSFSNPVYSMCRTGYLASTGFFVFDAILDWDVMIYDGSWSQFGKMSDNADKGGELPAGSAWALDNSTYMEEINYNADKTQDIEPLNPDSDALDIDPLSAPPNQVEDADSNYSPQQTTAPDDGDGGAPSPVDETPAIGC